MSDDFNKLTASVKDTATGCGRLLAVIYWSAIFADFLITPQFRSIRKRHVSVKGCDIFSYNKIFFYKMHV